MVWLNTGFVVFATALVFWRLFLLVSGRMVLWNEKILSDYIKTLRATLTFSFIRIYLQVNILINILWALRLGGRGNMCPPSSENLRSGLAGLITPTPPKIEEIGGWGREEA